MIRSLSLILALLLAGFTATGARAGAPAGYYDDAEGLTGVPLRQALTTIISANYQQLSYSGARQAMFQNVEDRGGDQVTCVYSNVTSTIGCLSSCANTSGSAGFDTEHSWPQSFFNSALPMQSDLHHLFPTQTCWNNSRGNTRFGYALSINNSNCVPNDVSYRGPSAQGDTVYQVHLGHRGDTARAMLYVITRYWDSNAFNAPNGPQNVTATQLQVYLAWHAEDPVDDFERTRNDRVFAVQNNRNPFVDRPEFVNMIWGGGGTPSPSPTAGGSPSPSPTMSNLPQPGEIIVNEIDYDDPVADDQSFIELKNASDRPINLNDIEIVGLNNSTTATYFVYRLGSNTLQPGAYWVLGTTADSAGVAASVNETISGLASLQNGANDGVYLRLVSSPATILDSVCYEGDGAHPETSKSFGNAGTDAGNDENFSLSRVPDGANTLDNAADFVLQASTPGGPNSDLGTPTPSPTAGPSGTPSPTPTVSPTAGSPTPTGTGGVAPGDIIINEVDYDDTDADGQSFIEIKNVSGRSLNLNELEVVGMNNSPTAQYFTYRPASRMLASGDYWVFGTTADSADVAAFVDETLFDIPSLQNGANDGITLRLFASPTVIIDSVCYEGDTAHPVGSPASGNAGTDPGNADNMSLSRVPDGVNTGINTADFVLQGSTPGQPNSVLPSPTVSPTVSPSPTTGGPTASPSSTATPTGTTASPTASPTGTTASPTASPTGTTASPTTSPTGATPSVTVSPTTTAGPTASPSPTDDPKATPSPTDGPSPSPTEAASPSASATSSPSPSPSNGNVIGTLLRILGVTPGADRNGDGITDAADLRS